MSRHHTIEHPGPRCREFVARLLVAEPRGHQFLGGSSARVPANGTMHSRVDSEARQAPGGGRVGRRERTRRPRCRQEAMSRRAGQRIGTRRSPGGRARQDWTRGHGDDRRHPVGGGAYSGIRGAHAAGPGAVGRRRPPAVDQAGEPAAHRRVQGPRSVQRDRQPRRRRFAPGASSPIPAATTRRPWPTRPPYTEFRPTS